MPDTKPVVDPAAACLRQPRKNNPEKTRQDILLAAIHEFAEQGLSGARVDAIAERTSTSKRMIYYYFGSKEQLYLAVLEKLYSDIRTTEAALRLDELDPEAAIRRLIEFTFDHHDGNVDFIRVASIESIHHGEHIVQSQSIRLLSKSIVTEIAVILAPWRRCRSIPRRYRSARSTPADQLVLFLPGFQPLYLLDHSPS